MIPAVVIKNYIQEQIGLYAVVSNDSSINVLEKKPTATITLDRRPYFADPDTEAITIRVSFYVNTSTQRNKDQFDDKIGLLFKAVNGVKKTTTHNAITYKYRLYFQSYEPVEVLNDTSNIMTLYEISGIVIATSSSAVSAVDIGVKLKHSADATAEPLILIKYSNDYTVNHELKVPVNSVETVAVPDNISRIHSIFFIADSRAASKHIEKTAMGITANSLTDTYSLELTASDGTAATKTVKLLNAVTDASVGGFMTISATFRGA